MYGPLYEFHGVQAEFVGSVVRHISKYQLFACYVSVCKCKNVSRYKVSKILSCYAVREQWGDSFMQLFV